MTRWLDVTCLRIVMLVMLALEPTDSFAEEGGSGHYFPGTISSFVDGVSPTDAFLLRLNVIRYDGGLGDERTVPVAGLVAVDVGVHSTAVGLTAFWRPGWGQLSERWSYAMSATIPFVDVTVNGDVVAEGAGTSGTVRRSDSESGLGDIVLMPLMFNYHLSDDLNINTRLAVYAPTGDFDTGRLANLGKNYWTFEPLVGVMYLGAENGREVSVFFGADFNTTNDQTEYKSGTHLHIDGTLAQHLPLYSGLLGLGVTGFWYQQVEGDSGAGASLGAFKGRANGIGPSLSYTHVIGEHVFLGEFKWVHEFAAKRRPEGNSFILKAMMKF